MTLRPHWVLLFATVLLAAMATSGDPPILGELPAVSLAGMDQQVADQLAEAREELAGLTSQGAGPGPVAEAYGRLGQLYLAYDIAGPAEVALRNASQVAPREPRWRYLLGALLQNERRLEDALAAYDAVLALRPSDLPTWIRRGNVLLGLQRLDDAQASFASAQRIAPTAASLTGLGKIAFERRENEAAVGHFLAALELQPSATALHYRLAQAFRELGDRAAARHHLELRGEVEPGFPDPLAQEILELTTGAGVQLMYGNRALRSGDLELALTRYRQALAENPRSATAHRALAAALARTDDVGGAIEHYEQALSLDPANPSWHYNLAILLADRGDAEPAERHLRAALAQLPDYTNARFNLASLLGRQGRYAEAVGELQRLLLSDPQDTASRRLLGLGLARLGEDQEAEVALRRVLADEHADRQARRALADLLARSGRYDEAAAELRQLVETTPEDEDARFAEAMALLLNGAEGPARSRLEDGVAALPDSRPLWHLLARLLATADDSSQRDGQRALEIAQRLLTERPEAPIAETVAMAFAELSRFAEAVELQERLVAQAAAANVGAPRIAELHRRLGLFRRGGSCRAPWFPAAGGC